MLFRSFKARRDYLAPTLEAIGFRITAQPEGAFYLYADCSALTDDSFGFARRLLEETGVAITPGIDFGNHGASSHVRFAYTNAQARLAEGVERIRQLLA